MYDKKKHLSITKEHKRGLNELSDNSRVSPRTDYTPYFSTWKEREERIKNLQHIDAKCNFDLCGNCEHTRKTTRTSRHSVYQSGVGCCSSCFYARGYFKHVPSEKLTYIQSLFLPVVGFWRPNTGCSLPRELRSDICLCFSCGDNKNKKYNMQMNKQLRKLS